MTMSNTVISGAALVRAADAMLRAIGGDTITLAFALVTLANDPSAQLGLADPEVQEVPLFPVVVRNLPSPNTGPRRRLEFLISSTAVDATVVSQNAASAESLFDSALGLSYDGDLFHIESVISEYFAGTKYMYKVTAVE